MLLIPKDDRQKPLTRQMPLRLLLVVPFVVQIFAAVGITGYISLRNGQLSVVALTDQLMDKTNNLVNEHLDNYLETPHQLNQLNLKAIEQGSLNLYDFQNTEKILWQQLNLFNVDYLNYSLVTGEFVGVGYYPNTKDIIIDEITSKNKTTGKTYTYITDKQGNPVKVKKAWSFEPHQESWYADAVKADKPIWSSIYTWDTPEGITKISISASYPFYDKNKKLLGVLGIDLGLEDIGDYLKKLKVSTSGKVFLIERDGLLVASSSNTKPYALDNGKAVRINASSNSGDPLIQAATKYLTSNFGNYQAIQQSQKLNFTYQGDRQFLQVTPGRDR
jgi:hypothetical protein